MNCLVDVKDKHLRCEKWKFSDLNKNPTQLINREQDIKQANHGENPAYINENK